MKIETKFKVGQEVYLIFRDLVYGTDKKEDFVSVYRTKIDSILIAEDSIKYYPDVLCDEFEETSFVDIDDDKSLVKKIGVLLNENNEND